MTALILKTPAKDSFVIKKVKSVGRDSINLVAYATVVDGADSFNMPHTGDYPVVPHPSLTGCFDRMTPYLAEYFGYTHFESVVNQKMFGADKAQKVMAKEVTEVFMKDLKVTGISYNAGRTGVIITGSYKGCALNTKAMYFSNESYGEALELICDDLDQEVYEYLFHGKKHQLDLDFEE